MFTDKEFANYDLIIHNVNDICNDIIDQARINRAERLTKQISDENRKLNKKNEDIIIPVESILPTDVVIRVMTYEHVPLQANKRSETVIEDSDTEIEEPIANPKYVKCNFPPFQHFKVDEQGNYYCVGKSHWQGDLIDGNWSRDHGTMTNTLALMFMKLCERYATRSNWRGYTYNDEMRSQALLQLSQIGLQFDESKSSNPFAYYTAAITNSFTRVLNIEKRNQNLRDDILEMNNFAPSYTRQGMLSGGHISDDHD